jgi:AbrB family looped-hinge helix DNA binding protein
MDGFHVFMAENGRLVLPAPLRQRLNLSGGGTLVIREEEGRLVLESLDAALDRAQALIRRHAPKAEGVTDAFLAERRAAAAQE